MKFFSLFTKTPDHQRFQYSPRYFDPKKEEMKEREERIKRELSTEVINDPGDFRSRLSHSFQTARKRSKPSNGSKGANLLRLGVLLYLVVLVMAFLTWGEVALYSLLLFIPFYFYLKFKKK